MSLADRVRNVAPQHIALRTALDALVNVPRELADVLKRVSDIQSRLANNSARRPSTSSASSNGSNNSSSNNLIPASSPPSSFPMSAGASSPPPLPNGKKVGSSRSRPSTASSAVTSASGTSNASTGSRWRPRLGSIVRRSEESDRAKEPIPKFPPSAFDFEAHQQVEIRVLQGELDRLIPRLDYLHGADSRRAQLVRNLEQLYSIVFDGPTPEAPEDDRLELAVRFAEDEFIHCSNTARVEHRTLLRITAALALEKPLAKALGQLKRLGENYEVTAAMAWTVTSDDAGKFDMCRTAVQTVCDKMVAQFAAAAKMNRAVVVPGTTLTAPIPNPGDWKNHKIKYIDLVGHFKTMCKMWLKEADRERDRALLRSQTSRQEATIASQRLTSGRQTLLDFRRTTFDEILDENSTSTFPTQDLQVHNASSSNLRSLQHSKSTDSGISGLRSAPNASSSSISLSKHPLPVRTLAHAARPSIDTIASVPSFTRQSRIAHSLVHAQHQQLAFDADDDSLIGSSDYGHWNGDVDDFLDYGEDEDDDDFASPVEFSMSPLSPGGASINGGGVRDSAYLDGLRAGGGGLSYDARPQQQLQSSQSNPSLRRNGSLPNGHGHAHGRASVISHSATSSVVSLGAGLKYMHNGSSGAYLPAPVPEESRRPSPHPHPHHPQHSHTHDHDQDHDNEQDQTDAQTFSSSLMATASGGSSSDNGTIRSSVILPHLGLDDESASGTVRTVVSQATPSIHAISFTTGATMSRTATPLPRPGAPEPPGSRWSATTSGTAKGNGTVTGVTEERERERDMEKEKKLRPQSRWY